MEADRNVYSKKYAKLIAKAWSDESFKERLLSDSRTVLEAEGFSVPQGVNIKVLEQTDTQLVIVIPKKPEGFNFCEIERRSEEASCFMPCWH
jgi:hypothetical protein